MKEEMLGANKSKQRSGLDQGVITQIYVTAQQGECNHCIPTHILLLGTANGPDQTVEPLLFNQIGLIVCVRSFTRTAACLSAFHFYLVSY